MNIVAFLCSARVWLAVALVITMGFGTAAADIHLVSADEIACQTADLAADHSDVEQGENDQRPVHDHHAHNCGSCHVHVAGVGLASVDYDQSDSASFRIGSNSNHPRAGPSGLYRPPRA